MKEYADHKRYVKPIEIEIGDTIFVKRSPLMKKSLSAYEEKPLEVTAKKGTMVTAQGNRRCITRNASFFKPYKGEPVEPRENEKEQEVLETITEMENDQQINDKSTAIEIEEQESKTPSTSKNSSKPVVTRSGRVSKPVIYTDFVKL